MSLKNIKSHCKTYLLEGRNPIRERSILDDIDITFWEKDSIFCDYQKELATDESPVLIIEKGRQIGFSWTMSFRAVFKALTNKKDTLISSYNKDAVKQFLKDSTSWAKIFNQIFEMITYEKIIDNQNINIFEIKFNNGRTITGLPGNPVSFRSYSGRDIIIDESAYRERPLDEYLGSALATLIHSGTVRIGSTHAGVDNDFNKLIERVKAGELKYKLMRVTFRDAVAEGLYKRICAKRKELWTQEKEDAWIGEIYDNYGIRASEELDAIPSDFSQEGKLFTDIPRVTELAYSEYDYLYFRYHDLAATEDYKDEIDTAYYSASVRVAYEIPTSKLIIIDYYAEKLSPLDGDARIKETAIQDGVKSIQIIEEEPGSTGKKYVAIMQEDLQRNGIYQVFGYNPHLKKVKRAIPVANAIQAGEVFILDEFWADDFVKIVRKFSSTPKPLVTDLVDCLSGCYDYIKNEFNWLLANS